jgi:N-[(2S)-2-amino-2-carboxyethyl]-L-glutamate dehydrogenase
MRTGDLLILRGPEVAELLAGRELEMIDIVRKAYETHGRGNSSLPHSLFLRFPEKERERIIALPAYLGEDWEVAGVKWVSSFPGNLSLGLDRASALVVMNSSRTGIPETILEGSLISAKRTAASAALAARFLHAGRPADRAGLVGCGLISFEIARFLLAALPEIKHLTLYDLDPARAAQFQRKCRKAFAGVEVEVAPDLPALLRSASLLSLATTAVTPHMSDLSAVAPGSTILHVSLRDLTAQATLLGDNVVDDVDHVCRAQTSVHLAEQLTGSRDFIRCTLADILLGKAPARPEAERIAIFSPFGLGVLDLALSRLVRELGLQQGKGTIIPSFLPEPWVEEQ